MAASGAGGRGRRALVRIATALLDLTVTKPIAIFVWWLSHRANRIEFRERAQLQRRVEMATRAGRPVLFASNHESMFDDPVLPMALYRTGSRALVELLVAAALIILCWAVPETRLPLAIPCLSALAWTVGISALGARKTWWSLGDLANFSSAATLRGKLQAGPQRPLSRIGLGLLAVADPAIFHFMRSAAAKTVLVDRRAGDEAKRARARAVEEAIEIAARAEPLWIFFEGGRNRVPGEIAPARRGIGEIVLGLRERGLDPLVVAVRHRGLARVIPRGSSRWFGSGQRIEVQWSECALEPPARAAKSADEPQSIADAVRNQVVRIELGKRDSAQPPESSVPGAVYRVCASLVGWGAMIAICLTWGALVIPATLLLSRFRPGAREVFNDLTRHVLGLYVRSLLFARFQVEGRERRLEGPRILVANHQSWLDPILMISLEPRLGGPIRRYMYRVPVLHSIVELAGFYPSDIGELPSLDELHRHAEVARDRRGALLFFPEGTRSKTGEIGPFHRGAFRVAVDHDLPIQPVVIEGLDRVLPAGHVVAQAPGRYTVRVRYLAPIEPPFGSGLRRDVVRSLTERVRGTLVDELARLRAERGATGRFS
jgi:1-acyl-sn-glycerol-3-phosphate acyltransferase